MLYIYIYIAYIDCIYCILYSVYLHCICPLHVLIANIHSMCIQEVRAFEQIGDGLHIKVECLK